MKQHLCTAIPPVDGDVLWDLVLHMGQGIEG